MASLQAQLSPLVTNTHPCLSLALKAGEKQLTRLPPGMRIMEGIIIIVTPLPILLIFTAVCQAALTLHLILSSPCEAGTVIIPILQIRKLISQHQTAKLKKPVCPYRGLLLVPQAQVVLRVPCNFLNTPHGRCESSLYHHGLGVPHTSESRPNCLPFHFIPHSHPSLSVGGKPLLLLVRTNILFGEILYFCPCKV